MYEDKRVTIVNDDDIEYGRVVIMEEGIGITIVDVNDSDSYLLCIKGPMCFAWKAAKFVDEHEEALFLNLAKDVFDYVSQCIESDQYIDIEYLNYMTYDSIGVYVVCGASAKNCPFI